MTTDSLIDLLQCWIDRTDITAGEYIAKYGDIDSLDLAEKSKAALTNLRCGEISDDEESAGAFLKRLGMDGRLWAQEFHKTAIKLGYSDMDQGWLISWFCNAVMAGYDEARRRDTKPVTSAMPATAPIPGDNNATDNGLSMAYEEVNGAEAATHQPVECPQCQGEGEYYMGDECHECFACKPHRKPKRESGKQDD